MTTMTLLQAATHPGWDRYGDGPPFPFVLIPLFWLTLAVAIVVTIIVSRRRAEATAGRRAGEQALAERFAAGAIEEEEFRARRAVLREKP